MDAPSEFDRQIALTPEGRGRYAADLDAGWSVGGGLNGGYLLALVGNAIRNSLPGKPDPLAVSAYYLSAARPGRATVTVDVRRDGGRVATASADLVQGDQARITVLATYGDLDGLGDDVRTTAPELDLPPVEECPRGSDAPPAVLEMAPIMGRFDMRFHPDDIGWVVGKPSGDGVMRAWFRLADGREPDPISLLMVLDALPPVTFNLGMPGWAPTLELSAHVRAKPAPGWLKVRHETRNLAGGMFEEDCEVWDSTGRLVAQSRQLAMQPRL
ncbi:thioesterase family protein [Nocardioides sp. W7]|uniref:thioesterase family protein n=1 Tax=Nocardioides sp. W7 TaxID=2931390 RepID=UPI001FD42F2A|nr:thioesterase family protein [Nocardioides sp. W7]